MRLGKNCVVSVMDLYDPKTRAIDEDNIGRLWTSMAVDGLIEPIVVIDRMIVSGVHRWETARRLGWETIAAIDVTGLGDVEIARIMIAENACRAHWSDKIRAAELAKLVEMEIPRQKENLQRKPRESTVAAREIKTIRPCPPTPKSEAIKAVAAQTGIGPKAVRDAVDHAARRIQKQQSESMAGGSVGVVDEFDAQIPAKKQAVWEKMRAALDQINRHAVAAQRLCTELREIPELADNGPIQRLKGEFHTIGFLIRAITPYAVCPKCGGAGCQRQVNHDPSKPLPFSCDGLGFVTDEKMSRAKFAKQFGSMS